MKDPFELEAYYDRQTTMREYFLIRADGTQLVEVEVCFEAAGCRGFALADFRKVGASLVIFATVVTDPTRQRGRFLYYHDANEDKPRYTAVQPSNWNEDIYNLVHSAAPVNVADLSSLAVYVGGI